MNRRGTILERDGARLFSRVAAAAVAVATTLFVSAPGASAATGTIEQVGTGRCVEAGVSHTSYLRTCDGGVAQQWNKTPGQFRAIATGTCLASNGSAVFTTTCSAETTRWAPVATARGMLLRHTSTGRCLGDGGSLSMSACSTTSGFWKF